MSTGYATAAPMYRAAGWTGVLPVPACKKTSPPSGFTGVDGDDPDDTMVGQWVRTKPSSNVVIRMPENVIGLDVDMYDDKPGRATLAALTALAGTDLPRTWVSTARSDGSGIRWFKIPAGTTTPDHDPGPGIELIRRSHRYAVVWPSIHPNGDQYVWINPDGELWYGPPAPDELTMLPDEWLEVLTNSSVGADIDKAVRVHVDPAPHPWDDLPHASWLEDIIADYNRSTTWADVLSPRWEHKDRRGDVDYWRYHGQSNPIGATTNATGNDTLITFSATAHADGWPASPSSLDRFGAHVLIETGRTDAQARVEVARTSLRSATSASVHADTALENCDNGESLVDRLRMALLRGCEIRNLPPPEWLIDGVWPARGLAALYGPSGHAKSFIALAMGGAVASGRAWCGHAVRPGTVVYVAAEGASGQSARLDAWLAHRGLDDVPNLIWLPMPVNLTSPIEVAALIQALKDIDPNAVIFDTQARCTVGAEENSARDMGMMIAACDRIVAELGAAVLLIHHSGMDIARGLRGSTAELGAMDAVVAVHRDGDGNIKFKIEKMKNGPEDVAHTFRLEPVAESVVAIEVVRERDAMPDDLAEMLGVLAELDEGGGVASGVWMRSAGVAERTFHRRRKLLLTATYCEQSGSAGRWRYHLTEHGRKALSELALP